jgi:hypothetical protein
VRSVGDRGEAADDRVACDERNDGRGTPIATLLAHAPDAIRGDGSATAVLMRVAYAWALPNAVRPVF